jgi:hypothetical protein
MNTETTIIDCDATPFCPEGWEIVEHRKCGQIEWNPEKIILLHTNLQRKGNCVICSDIYSEVREQNILNANVADYLITNPSSIPKKWRDCDYRVMFWGTIYRDEKGYLYARRLVTTYDHNRIDNEFICLEGGLYFESPAALLK